MFLQPRAPSHIELRAGLQDRRDLARYTAAHHARVAAMFGCEDLDDRRGLAMFTRAQKGALIPPVHVGTVTGRAGRSIRKARFIQQVAACAVFDLDHPEVRVEAALPGQRRIHAAFIPPLRQDHPGPFAGHQVEAALVRGRVAIERVQLDQNGPPAVRSPFFTTKAGMSCKRRRVR